MSDSFGAVQVPLVPPLAEHAVTDPCVSYLLSFLQAFLNANAPDAWERVAPNSRPVHRVFAHDPEQVVFNEKDLPALYAWRSSGESERMAEDWLVESSALTLLWVFPTAPQHPQKVRAPFMNGLAKAVNVALERGRTPAWIVPGDPEPRASDEGSLVYTWTGLMKVALTKWKPSKLVIMMADTSPKRAYAALEMTVEVQENLEIDLERFDALDGVDQTIRAGGAAVRALLR